MRKKCNKHKKSLPLTHSYIIRGKGLTTFCPGLAPR